jgi:AcrR family transcriptional regulator
MKETFDRLGAEKRSKIIEACVQEFGEHGFEGGSTDRICRASGISKGGLYEYIESKEDLFVCAISHVYGRLYDFIRGSLRRSRKGMPADVLERFERVSAIAIEFYLEHPRYISLIQKSNNLSEPELKAQVDSIFRESFMTVFGGVDGAGLRFPPAQIIELLAWFLLKTRNDFLSGYARGESKASLKRSYLKEWSLYTDALARGIYR